MSPKADLRSGLPCPNPSASFWHSELNKYLLYHQSSEKLSRHADIVIVGSGITGASVANYLAEDTRAKESSVCMLEAREVCWGATGRNGGHCEAVVDGSRADIVDFEIRNVNAVQAYIEKYKVPCEWRSVTACQTFWTDELMAAAEKRIADLQSLRPNIGKLVHVIKTTAELEKHHVAPSAAGATLTQVAGCFWPYKYVAFMLEKLVRNGRLSLHTNTPVESVTPYTGLDVGLGPNAPRWTINTPRGTMTAHHVILATNAYTSHLLPSFSSLIVPVRCGMSALLPPKDSVRLTDSYDFVGFDGANPDHDDYLIQRPFADSVDGERGNEGGHLMFGGGRDRAEYNCVGEWEDNIVDEGEAAYLRKTLLRTLQLGGHDPEVMAKGELRASHQWTGIKGFSRDNLPWVGRVPDVGAEGLWLVGGYTGHGMSNATLCGKAVVEMVLAEQASVDLETLYESLIDKGDLPRSYLITAERLKSALELPTVEVQNVHGRQGPMYVKSTKLKPATSDQNKRCEVM